MLPSAIRRCARCIIELFVVRARRRLPRHRKRRWAAFSPSYTVSALMFDYILTGPNMAACRPGRYIVGLVLDGSIAIWNRVRRWRVADPETATPSNAGGARQSSPAASRCNFFRGQNLIGIHGVLSEARSIEIMMATTIMAVTSSSPWCRPDARHPGDRPTLRSGAPPTSATKVQYELAARYKISDDTVISLRNADVPKSISDALNPQTHKEFADEFDNTKAFVRAVANAIGEEDSRKYLPSILAASKVLIVLLRYGLRTTRPPGAASRKTSLVRGRGHPEALDAEVEKSEVIGSTPNMERRFREVSSPRARTWSKVPSLRCSTRPPVVEGRRPRFHQPHVRMGARPGHCPAHSQDGVASCDPRHRRTGPPDRPRTPSRCRSRTRC